MNEIEVGSLVQITDPNHSWFPAVLIVDEVKSWGVVAYIVIPKSNDGSEVPGFMYNRLKFKEITLVGVATVWVG